MSQSLHGVPWEKLDVTYSTKDIPPGWLGPSSSTKTFERWKEDVEEWKNLQGNDADAARISAILLRVTEEVKEYAKKRPAVALDDDPTTARPRSRTGSDAVASTAGGLLPMMMAPQAWQQPWQQQQMALGHSQK